MKIVTLLSPREEYILYHEGSAYRFFKGCPLRIPDDVAERCATILNGNKRPAFLVQPDTDADADVAGMLGIQTEFAKWPSYRL